MLETYPILSFLVVIFSAKINFNPIYLDLSLCPGIIRVPGKDYRQPDGIVPPACPAERAEALADVVNLKQNRDWQEDLDFKNNFEGTASEQIPIGRILS